MHAKFIGRNCPETCLYMGAFCQSTNIDTCHMAISITARAADRLRTVALSEGVNLDDAFLRVAVKPGGCSGLTYDLGWDTTVRETDEVTQSGGLNVVIDPRSHAYIDGTELDFTDGLDGQGFHFLNPQAARTCACGDSFGL